MLLTITPQRTNIKLSVHRLTSFNFGDSYENTKKPLAIYKRHKYTKSESGCSKKGMSGSCEGM